MGLPLAALEMGLVLALVLELKLAWARWMATGLLEGSRWVPLSAMAFLGQLA